MPAKVHKAAMVASPSPPAPALVARELLAWYDRHRRDLPWRAVSGTKPDPYAIWLSEIMLQQTTVAAVKPYFARFLARWPNVRALAAAPRDEVMSLWAGLGYYARARNLHDCAATIVARHGGAFPTCEAQLRELPGIGDYTAAAIAAIAFGEAAVVVDGNVERVVARLHAIETPLPKARPEIRARVAAMVPAARPGDFAQAMMDFGATLCTPKSPACTLCPLASPCAARLGGDPTEFPRRLLKKPRPLRLGAMAVIAGRDGAIVVRTRPASGLLGGMTEFFGTDWTEHPADASPLQAFADLSWRVGGTVEHVFTHFALRLAVFAGETTRDAPPDGYRWIAPAALALAPLPSLMHKVLEAASGTPARPSAVVPLDARGLGLVGLEGADQQRRRKRENHKA
jgi:A/G-specific adenine glycosylase